MRSIALAAGLALSGCGEPAPAARVCEDFEPVARDPLSLEATREAHRWSALRRRLRFEEARAPGYVMRTIAARVPRDGATDANACLSELYIAGRLLFEHELAPHDGLGDQLAAARPRHPLQRVHAGTFGGPDTNSCRSCHWRGGAAGAGDLPDAALLYGDGDRVSSADARNPPALHGAGVVEALARQITDGLAVLREEAEAEAARTGRDAERALVIDGVDFGLLRARPDGTLDTSGLVGIDTDLVVRPFGWKGTFATLREIIEAAFQVHLGIQSDALVQEGDAARVGDGPPLDPDRDGVTSELSEGQLDAVVAFVASRGIPRMRPHERIDDLGPIAEELLPPTTTIFLEEWTRGRARFDALGCASCHTPRWVLRSPRLPVGRAGSFAIDLAREAEHPRIAEDAAAGGYPVFLFSDLRRHDLGVENASRHVDAGVAESVFLTRPLWGLADSSPYSHDGRSPSLDHAIARHGGEAAAAREAFDALSLEARGELRVFLLSLRREWRPEVPP